jgi:hypothetical protein
MPATSDLSQSLSAEMHLDEARFLVNTIEYGLNRNTDERGFPTDAPKRTMISLKISPLEDDEVRLVYDWALNSDRKMDGYIVFNMWDDRTVEVRRMDFLEATCVGFRESFFNHDLNVVHERPQICIPNSRDYFPFYRGRAFFAGNGLSQSYQLVISAKSMLIQNIEIPS